MVVILSDVALLGKSFFDALEVAFAVRVGLRVDLCKVREKAIGRDFFADRFPQEVGRVRVTTTAQGFADVEVQSNTGFDECVVEVGLGDFHNLRIPQVAKNARDFLRLKKYFFVLDKRTWHAS